MGKDANSKPVKESKPESKPKSKGNAELTRRRELRPATVLVNLQRTMEAADLDNDSEIGDLVTYLEREVIAEATGSR